MDILRQAHLNRRERQRRRFEEPENNEGAHAEDHVREIIDLVADVHPGVPSVGLQFEDDWFNDPAGSHPAGFQNERCPIVDDDNGQDVNGVTFETIPLANKIRLRINGVLFCYDVRTLKMMLLDAELDDEGVPILEDPFTRSRFSARQIQRIQNHPTMLGADVLAERERLRLQRLEEERQADAAIAAAWGGYDNNVVVQEPAAVRRRRLEEQNRIVRERERAHEQFVLEGMRKQRLQETMDAWHGFVVRLKIELTSPPILGDRSELLLLSWARYESRFHWLRRNEEFFNFPQELLHYMFTNAYDVLEFLVRARALPEITVSRQIPHHHDSEPLWTLPLEMIAERRGPRIMEYKPLALSDIITYITTRLASAWLPFYGVVSPAGVARRRMIEIRPPPSEQRVLTLWRNVQRFAIISGQFSTLILPMVKRLLYAQDEYIREAHLRLPQDLELPQHATEAQQRQHTEIVKSLSQVRRWSNSILELILECVFTDAHNPVGGNPREKGVFTGVEQATLAAELFNNIMLPQIATTGMRAVLSWSFNNGGCHLLCTKLPLSSTQRRQLLFALLQRLEFEENQHRPRLCQQIVDTMLEVENLSPVKFDDAQISILQRTIQRLQMPQQAAAAAAAAAAASNPAMPITLKYLTHLFQTYVVGRPRNKERIARSTSTVAATAGQKHGRNHQRASASSKKGNDTKNYRKPSFKKSRT